MRVIASIQRWPETDNELWALVRALWGVKIPRQAMCPNHQSPFQAFADAYFARTETSVWKASRGLGGKSTLLAILTLTEMVTMGARITLLGGTGQQSQRVLETMSEGWNWPNAPRNLLYSQPGTFKTILTNGGRAIALMASQASVRGPHPNRMRCDEIEDFTQPLLDAAMGQPMSSRGITAQTVLSSTYHVPNGTMAGVLKRAESEEGWKLAEWCWRETIQPHGWLDPLEVERARRRVPDSMFEVEYDLQAPSQELRAILTEAVEAAFNPELGEVPGDLGVYYEFEAPEFPAGPEAPYAHGADWAKEVDFTVIATYRTDEMPWRLVAWERKQRCGWPDMVAALEVRIAVYGGRAAHDGTGLGDVIDDYLQADARAVILAGKERSTVFANYLAALEHGEMTGPRITWSYNSHKDCRRGDLFGAGHPPDDIVAGAIAWHTRSMAEAWEVW